MQNPLISYLGEQSYPAILLSIKDKIRDTKADTILGNQLLSDVYKVLNESASPIMQLKAFTTNAESVASNDAKLIDVVNFARNQVKNGDLNFLVNVAKEQHLENLSRTGFPSPEQTLKDIKSLFNEPASVIEAGIVNGLFDKLETNLIMEVKNDLIEDKSKNKINTSVDKVVDLNESYIVGKNQNIAIYSPVAVRLEDTNNGNIVLLTESCVLTINGEESDLCMVENPSTVEIPLAHKRLMTALTNLNYDPGKNEFGLTQNWDFTLTLTDAGSVTISKEGVDREIIVENSDVPSLLLESIDAYSKTKQNFNSIAFSQDADNFIMLMENHSKLIRLDECKTIKNLDTQEYVMVDLFESSKPRLIASSKGIVPMFESYGGSNGLVDSINMLIGEDVTNLFESQIKFESQKTAERFEKLTDLRESQKELNTLITENNRLKEIADEDSPVMVSLMEQSNKLKNALDQNIEEINVLENRFKFY